MNEHKVEHQLNQKKDVQINQLKVAKQIDSYLKQKHFNGTVLIEKDGKIVLMNGYGLSNFTTKTYNDTDTIFRIGSVTKTITATAIMQLVEQGKVKLEDPISTYISDFPSGDKITIHHLLSHTSGIPEFLFGLVNDETQLTKYVTLEELVHLIASLKLQSESGTNYSYANSNYALLAYIVERASHTNWDNYVNEYFFKPLKMYRSGVDINNPIAPNYAVGTGMFVDKHLDMSYAIGSGAVYSTVGDLYKFDQALLSGKLISQQSLDKMFTPVLHGYGYAWKSGQDLDLSSDWKWHDGDIPGFASLNAVNQKNHMEVIMMTNQAPNTMDDYTKLMQFKKDLTHLAAQLIPTKPQE